MEEPWGPAKPRMGSLHDPPARAPHLAVPAPPDKPQIVKDILWVLRRSVLLMRHRSTHHSDQGIGPPNSSGVGVLWFGLIILDLEDNDSMNTGCGKEYVLKEENKNHLPSCGEKMSACVDSDTQSAWNVEKGLHSAFDFIYVQLAEPSRMFQLLKQLVRCGEWNLLKHWVVLAVLSQ